MPITIVHSAADQLRYCHRGFQIALKAVIRNAIEHNNSEDIEVEVTVAERLRDEYVDVRIADNGLGINLDAASIAEGDMKTDQSTTHLNGLGV